MVEIQSIRRRASVLLLAGLLAVAGASSALAARQGVGGQAGSPGGPSGSAGPSGGRGEAAPVIRNCALKTALGPTAAGTTPICRTNGA